MPFGKKAPAVATWSAHDLNVDGVSCDIRERKSRGKAAGWTISVGHGKGTVVYPFYHSIATGAFPDGFPCEDVWKARVRADSRFVACKEATEARCVPNPNSCQGQREDRWARQDCARSSYERPTRPPSTLLACQSAGLSRAPLET